MLSLGVLLAMALPASAEILPTPVTDALPQVTATLPGVTITKLITLRPKTVTVRKTVTNIVRTPGPTVRVPGPVKTTTVYVPQNRVVTSVVPAPGLTGRSVVTLPRETVNGPTESTSKSGTVAVTKTVTIAADRVVVPKDRIVIERAKAAGVSIGLVVLGVLLALGTMWALYALGYLTADDRNAEKMEELVKEVKSGDIGPPE